MDRDIIVKYTPEGFKEAAQLLDMFPEDQREGMLMFLVRSITTM